MGNRDENGWETGMRIEEKLLRVSQLNKSYGEGFLKRQVLRDFSFELGKKETIGITGESGSGKSTLARIITGLEDADGGAVLLEGRDILKMNGIEMKTIRPHLQLVFQNYRKALNPYMKVEKILKEAAPGQDYTELLERVGLDQSILKKHSSQLSGGQAQRLNIIRAVAICPKVLILDEATSGLDPQTIEDILFMLKEAQQVMEFGLIIISHDLKVIEKACTRFIEM